MIHSLSEYHSITDHLDLHLFSSIENHVKSPLTQADVFYQLKANDVYPLYLNNHRLSIKSMSKSSSVMEQALSFSFRDSSSKKS